MGARANSPHPEGQDAAAAVMPRQAGEDTPAAGAVLRATAAIGEARCACVWWGALAEQWARAGRLVRGGVVGSGVWGGVGDPAARVDGLEALDLEHDVRGAG